MRYLVSLLCLVLTACSAQGGVARSYVISEKEDRESMPLLSEEEALPNTPQHSQQSES